MTPTQPTPAPDALVQFEGAVERVLFQNQKSGFLVARFRMRDTEDLVTIVGEDLPESPDLPIRVWAVEQNHPRFGLQYKVERYEPAMPTGRLGLLRYLGSGSIKGIGPQLAEQIVDHFGDDTLQILDEEPKRLLDVRGIGRKKLDSILLSWEKQSGLRKTMMFLQERGVSPGYAMKIHNEYGEQALAVLQRDPYRMARDIAGIGFRIADRIARNIGVKPDAFERLCAGIEYALEKAIEDGHVYLPESVLLDESSKLLDVDVSILAEALEKIFMRGGEDRNELYKDGDRVYLASYYSAEVECARRLADIIAFPDPLDLNLGRQVIDRVRRDLGFELTEEQSEVMEKLLETRIAVLTGGPGTGKTVVTRAVIRMLQELNLEVKLAAPTGRAAKRMEEAAGSGAATIHRLLEYNPRERMFGRNKKNPIEADALILDETSMVDLKLMRHLLRALRPGCRLLIVGDVDQLPSVGAGNVLRDIIDSRVTATVRLNRIFRQAEESLIVANAHRINGGRMPLTPAKGVESDFYFIQREKPEDIVAEILSLVSSRLKKKYGFSPFKDIQVMTPMHKGLLGVENLNAALQQELNGHNRPVPCGGGRTFRLGDKVMQVRNNYDKDVFNGDIGVVRRIDAEGGTVRVAYPDRTADYKFGELDQLTLAYAITIHKSQGSEYAAAVIPVSAQHFIMLQRNLLYTALTRARKLAVFVGTQKAIAIAVKNNKIEERYSGLKERLKEFVERGAAAGGAPFARRMNGDRE